MFSLKYYVCLCIILFFSLAISMQSALADSSIFDLAMQGKTVELEKQIQKYPILVSMPDLRSITISQGATLLIYASMYHQLDTVQMLLNYRANIESRDGTGRSALDWVKLNIKECSPAWVGSQEAELRQMGFNESKIEESFKSLISSHTQADKLAWEKVQNILETALSKEREENQQSSLFTDVIASNINNLEGTLKTYPNVNIQGENGETPLLIAVRNGNENVAQLLIEYGADPNIQDDSGLSASAYIDHWSQMLSTASERSGFLLLKQEMQAGLIDINARDPDGNTMIMRVAAEGDMPFVALLIRLGAKTDIKNNQGQSLEDLISTYIDDSAAQHKKMILNILSTSPIPETTRP
jgi:uncharacterized protein